MPAARTNVLSIADSTGIPRETVRRKVRELLEMKLIFRSGRLLGLSGAGWGKISPGLRRMACSGED
jgi:DNA-binding Lrp family transcriptional regulator